MPKTFLEDETSSSGSLDALISNVGKRMTHVEVLMSLLSCRKRRHIPICKGGNMLQISFGIACGL